MDVEKVHEIAEKWRGKRGGLIAALQETQSELNYLPSQALTAIAKDLGLPLSQVCSVATFYTSFSLEPRGRRTVTCCTGTACHVRGGERVAKEVSRLLGIEPGQTTEDREFTFGTVRCLGACALAPVVVVDGRYYGKMTSKKVRGILSAVRSAEKSE